MNIKRRLFLKRTAVGTIGLGVGISATSKLLSCSPHTEYEAVFPFFRYIEKFNIGEYISKDQGGKFMQESLLHSEDDLVITRAIRGGLLEKVYGNPIGWKKFENGIDTEKSIWLSRFYFLPSFARMYYLTKDKSYLEDMMRIFRLWSKDNPRPTGSETTRYIWRDMQAAWRAINLCWCYYLGYEGLSDEDREFIYHSLSEHGQVLLSGFGTEELSEFNHQSHGALSMLYVGILFPSLPESKKLVENGIRILTHHLKHAFYNDGGNVEQMFGYFPFEASLFRDMYLLCRANNIQAPEETIPLLKKMAHFISSVAQPDGTAPPINDSYPMPVFTILDTINDILDGGLEFPVLSSQYFPDTQIGVLRSNKTSGELWYCVVNPVSVIGDHAHAGRLGFHLWYNNHPLITDSGCCSYDNPLFSSWYRTSLAHNTVLIDDKEEEPRTGKKTRRWYPKRKTENKIIAWKDEPSIKHCRMVSPESDPINSSVRWTRDIVLVKDKYLIIHDSFEAVGKHNYKLLFHFVSSDIETDKKKLWVKSNSAPVLVIPGDSEIIKKVDMVEGYVFQDVDDVMLPYSVFEMEAEGTIHSVIGIIPIKDECFDVSFSQEVSELGLRLEINDNGENTAVRFDDSACRLLGAE